MSETKKLSAWEKERGIILKDATVEELNTKFTQDEVTDFFASRDKETHGVNWEDRTEFLKLNGYEVTRENMVADLPNTITPEPDLGQQLVDELKAMQEVPETEAQELTPPPEA